MSEQKIRTIPIDQIVNDPDQPRKHFDEAEIANLAESIRMQGLRQPIGVRPIKRGAGEPTTYQILYGERRYRAHKLLKWDHIKCIVETGVDDDQKAIFSILENLMRVDISPMEEARAFQQMLERDGWNIPRLQKELGLKTRSRVTNRLDLLKLAPEHQQLVESGAINASMAFRIGQVDQSYHDQLIQRIAKGELRTAEDVMHAVCAIKQAGEQGELMDEDAEDGGTIKPAQRDLDTVSRMEAKVEQIAKMVQMAFLDGECRIAELVSRDRTQMMADKLVLIRKHVLQMERALTGALAQGNMKLAKKGKKAAAKEKVAA